MTEAEWGVMGGWLIVTGAVGYLAGRLSEELPAAYQAPAALAGLLAVAIGTVFLLVYLQ